MNFALIGGAIAFQLAVGVGVLSHMNRDVLGGDNFPIAS